MHINDPLLLAAGLTLIVAITPMKKWYNYAPLVLAVLIVADWLLNRT